VTAAEAKSVGFPLRASLTSEPHRLLFPLGVLLAGLGVLPWIFFALGLTEAYRPIFHSVAFRSMFHPLAEVEGFLSCFAVGCLFTTLPRRTGTSPPAAWQMAVAVGAPLIIVISAALQRWELGQIAWLALIAMATEFWLRRLRSQLGRLLVSVIWVGLALLMGVAGAVLAAAGMSSGEEWFWVHELGRSFLTQGLFTALVLGTAGLLLPTREGRAKPTAAGGLRWALAVHTIGCAVFLASFWIGQFVSLRLGFGLRAAVTLAVTRWLVHTSQMSNPDDARARAARIAMWMLPLGNAAVALAPAVRRGGMHVIYLGCFAMLVLVASTCISSVRRTDRSLHIGPWQLGLGATCLALAVAARILVETDPPNFKLWLGSACVLFVGAMLFVFQGFSDRLVSLFQIDSDEGSLRSDERN
jgi:uncharacterized protein involved in response to NO